MWDKAAHARRAKFPGNLSSRRRDYLSMKLVIVDDDSLLCSALSRCLVRLNHSARMANSVESALALIAAEAPVAVLTDLDLGVGGDGVELITRLRASGSKVPILMMTGSEIATARARLQSAGVGEIALLEKPFEIDVLMRSLAELLPLESIPIPAPTLAPAPARATPLTMAARMGNAVRSLGGRVI
jgi:DNA-binding NtrC family response regulator